MLTVQFRRKTLWLAFGKRLGRKEVGEIREEVLKQTGNRSKMLYYLRGVLTPSLCITGTFCQVTTSVSMLGKPNYW